MLDQIHLLAAVTVLGVLEQAYFFLQVIYARRAFGISPPKTSGPPEFERIFRAQVNSSEYFPIFLALLWQAGLFFHQGQNSLLPGLSLDLFPRVLAQSSGPAHPPNNKLGSNSVSDGRVEPEDTKPLFLHFGLPTWLKVAPSLEMVTLISVNYRSGRSLGSALSLRPLLLLYGIQDIVFRKAHPNILQCWSSLDSHCSFSPGHPAFLPLSLLRAECPPASHSVTCSSVPRWCPRL
ncbi:uncharacterized protein LOC113485336 isoform X1 [Athene cunicularia]|uniref:uncharacterized protein LOC113485336 isoform X1 n=1 Tax=Athene cunicularia TaxID=194338 RepID=UPI000EF7258F|nr:uncharacterized protein LOC113485336 isoform X1 [Athene cunicularia]